MFGKHMRRWRLPIPWNMRKIHRWDGSAVRSPGCCSLGPGFLGSVPAPPTAHTTLSSGRPRNGWTHKQTSIHIKIKIPLNVFLKEASYRIDSHLHATQNQSLKMKQIVWPHCMQGKIAWASSVLLMCFYGISVCGRVCLCLCVYLVHCLCLFLFVLFLCLFCPIWVCLLLFYDVFLFFFYMPVL